MARIPTIIAERGINTGAASQEASYSAFNSTAGGEAISQGLQQNAQAAAQWGSVIAEKQKAQKDKDGLRWVSESESQFQAEVTDQMAALKNDENSPGKFRDWFNSRVKDYQGNAPDKAAEDRFRNMALGHFNRGYEGLTGASAQVKVGKIIEANDALVTSDINNFSRVFSDPGIPVDPHEQLISGASRTLATIDEQLGGVAPGIAKAKKAAAAEQYFFGAVNAGALGTAREIVNRFVTNEETKHSMLERLKREESVSNGLLADKITSEHRADINSMIQGVYRPMPSDENLKSAFGKEWEVKKQQMERDRAGAWGGFEIGSKLNGKNEATIDAIIADHAAASVTSGKPEEQAAVQYARATAEALKSQIKNDPASYLVRNNPFVIRAARAAAEAINSGDNNRILEANRQMIGQIIKFNGFPTAEEKDASTYLFRPDTMIDVMSTDAAKKTVQDIEKGNHEQALGAIQNILNRYAPEHRPIVFNQLVRNGLKGSYELIAAADNPTVAKRMIASEQQDLKGAIGKYTREEVNKAVASDPQLSAFFSGFSQGGQERGIESQRYNSTLENYAASLVKDGVNPKDAAKQAYQEVIAPNFASIVVNGYGTFISAKNGLGVKYSQEELGNIQSNLKLALQSINVAKLDLSPFPAVKREVDSGDKARAGAALHTLYKNIVGKAKFYPDADGKGVSLFYEAQNPDGTGSKVDMQLHGTNGNAIRLRTQDVPSVPVQLARSVNPLRPDGDLVRSKQSGFMGMANLMNPWSPQNIANRVYGNEGMNLFGKLYFGGEGVGFTEKGFWNVDFNESNWPSWAPHFEQ